MKIVRTLARTMFAYERLVAGFSNGPRAASRREASASDRPRAGTEGIVAVVAMGGG